ncbi:MAG: bifunctional serine/threonine-protein kinase/formylglycine-generating enzyme family protein, partial [Planctomycetota bacterium]
KVLQLGVVRDDVLARFAREAELLGRLKHPGIAQVFDAGTFDAGHGSQPYFAMELVDGEPLTTYATGRALDLRSRCALLASVCDAVQHAHERGVIHRDLKPGNILVAEPDPGQPQPKVLDFGIARATEHGADDATLLTRTGMLVGTLAYMSPEQVSGDGEIDHRADVYALGVLLYELLTDELPLDVEGRPLSEIMRIVRDDEPDRLGTRNTQLRGDVETIAATALAKEPERRYVSAAAMADDLRRYLADQPIAARPKSTWYYVRKFASRHRALVGGAAATLLVSVLGGITALVYAMDARAQSEIASARTEEFELLSLVEHLRVARTQEEGMYPAWPEQTTPLRTWLGRDVARVRRGLDQAVAALQVLRDRGAAASAEEREALRKEHPRYRELQSLRAELATLRRAQGVRDGTINPAPAALPAAAKRKTANKLNKLAYPLIDPDRVVFGREAEGLALAQAGCDRAGYPDTTGLRAADLYDTYAWALFANGRDEDAMAASRACVAAVPADQRHRYDGYLHRITQAVANARGLAGAAQLAGLARDVAQLEDQLAGERGRWQFAQEADRFLHDTLEQTVRDGEVFLTRRVPLVEQRLAWAGQVEELTLRRFADRWAEAREAIARADGVGASTLYAEHPIELAPQLGLVPIGMNPATGLWEFYHLRSAWEPALVADPRALPTPSHHPETGAIDVGQHTGIVFVLLPGGTFRMGAQADDPNAPNYDPLTQPMEAPVHEVTLAPFFLARHELTQGQWARLTAGGVPSLVQPGKRGVTAANPVERVDWHDSDRVLRQHGLALPTEAQWEYGCRAGTSTPWWTGVQAESLGHDRPAANLADRAAARAGAEWPALQDWLDDGWLLHAPVDTFRPNPWGLHNVHGNVWEWCRDWHRGYREPVRPGDGLRPGVDSYDRGSTRGGGFDGSARMSRSAHRDRGSRGLRDENTGLRASRAVWP